MLKNKKNAIIFSIFAMLLWGSAIPTIKTTYHVLDVSTTDTGAKILIAGMRFFLAGLITFLYLRLFNKEKIVKSEINWKFIIIIGILQTFIQYILYYIGLSHIAGVKSSIIQASNSFIVVILSLLLLPGDKINKNMIIALILGTAGIIVTNLGKGASSEGFKFTGDGFILISTSINALCTVLIRKYGQKENSYFLMANQFIIGSILMIITGLLLKDGSLVFNIRAVILLIYAAFISATAFTIWTVVLKYHSAGEFGIYKLFVPLFGSILSVLILGEAFTLNLAIGMVLVLGGSLVLNLNKN
ncbi:DMT family transporter [Anaerococcus lactolyticus]|uniref:Membrane protein n=1 Tax=Anaerococcus lactolyticus S7-1-13 TaxID=1284686 RepID=A0A095YEF7_9FIRM|nr:DMT family transporter [Anaerococcus lactolyticus]KGF04957.1 membrane protein [Anaerococcus lactolyticus S7-1-13]